MKMRIAKRILGISQEVRGMFRATRGWRIEAYRRRTVVEAHNKILRMERRHGFPSKWS